MSKIELGAPVEPTLNDDETRETKYYNFRIVTDKGFCNLEMRNSSNGYYGGSIVNSSASDDDTSIEVRDDF